MEAVQPVEKGRFKICVIQVGHMVLVLAAPVVPVSGERGEQDLLGGARCVE
jgi:hypothetical protein